MKRALAGLLALAAFLTIVLWPDDASAHALLARADPPINASLRESPIRITLFMTEQLQRSHSSIQVLHSSGERRDIGQTEFADEVPTQMSVRVLKLDPGVYTVVWETLSEVDGHTWTGSYVFSVLNPDGSAPAGSGVEIDLDRPGTPVAADAAVKAIGLAALVIFAGAVFISWLLRPSPISTLLPLMAVTLVVGIATTGYESIAGALRLGDIGFLGDVLFDTRNGLWLQQRWYALIVAAALVGVRLLKPVSLPDRLVFVALAVLAAVWLASSSAISHGAAIGSGWIWGTLFDALHLSAAALWIGGLLSLIIVIRGQPDARIAAVRRFSVAAALSVPVLAAAGLLSALIQIPNLNGIVETDWGLAFIVKIAILVALFAAAAANAFFLRPRDAAADGQDQRLVHRFSRMMRMEALLGLAVIAASAALTQLPSPASAQPEIEQKDNTVVETVTRGGIIVALEISPNLVGFNTWTATIRGTGDNPVEVLLLRFRYADRSVGPVTVPTTRLSDNQFQLEGAYFGLPGAWTVEMELRRATGEDLIVAVQADVESGYQASPFATDSGGALALPLTQMDWNGVGALWALVIGGLAWVNRPHIRRTWGPRGGDAAFAAGLLGLIVAVVLLTGLHVEPGRTLANPIERTAESVERGSLLFAANCASCHGETGAGDGPLADSLPAPPANFTVHVPFHPDGVLFAWITDGIRGTGMPAWAPQLSDQERWDLVNFLRANFDISAAQ
ncbi:MAG: CopD family protein [Chloroflexota bacterium]|nr:CopD family protein [Chloroflexota bacterium]